MNRAVDLAKDIISVVLFAIAVGGIIYRQGRSEQKVVNSVEMLAQNVDSKIEALKVGQAQSRANQEQILGEVKAHTGNASIHVNTQLEALKEKVDEDFKHDVVRKLDEILRAK